MDNGHSVWPVIACAVSVMNSCASVFIISTRNIKGHWQGYNNRRQSRNGSSCTRQPTTYILLTFVPPCGCCSQSLLRPPPSTPAVGRSTMRVAMRPCMVSDFVVFVTSFTLFIHRRTSQYRRSQPSTIAVGRIWIQASSSTSNRLKLQKRTR